MVASACLSLCKVVIVCLLSPCLPPVMTWPIGRANVLATTDTYGKTSTGSRRAKLMNQQGWIKRSAIVIVIVGIKVKEAIRFHSLLQVVPVYYRQAPQAVAVAAPLALQAVIHLTRRDTIHITYQCKPALVNHPPPPLSSVLLMRLVIEHFHSHPLDQAVQRLDHRQQVAK